MQKNKIYSRYTLWYLIILILVALPITENSATAQVSTENEGLTATTTPSSGRTYPINKIWEYIVESPTRFRSSHVNNFLFIQSSNNQITALNSTDGKLLWETPLNGTHTSDIGLGKTSLYVCTEQSGDNDKKGILCALDINSGTTQWTKKLNSSVISQPIEEQNSLYIIDREGTLLSLKYNNGEQQWESHIVNDKYQKLTVDSKNVFLGSNKGLIRALDNQTGTVLWDFIAEGQIGEITITQTHVYAGSSNGFLYVLNRHTGKLIWKRRTGAAITAAPLLTDKYLFVASFDNFLYALNPVNGSLIWRQQLNGRLSIPLLLLDNKSLVVAPFDGKEISIIDTHTGDLTAQLKLETERILGALTIVGNLLIIPTDRGIIATSIPSTNSSTKTK